MDRLKRQTEKFIKTLETQIELREQWLHDSPKSTQARLYGSKIARNRHMIAYYREILRMMQEHTLMEMEKEISLNKSMMQEVDNMKAVILNQQKYLRELEEYGAEQETPRALLQHLSRAFEEDMTENDVNLGIIGA